MSINLQDGGVMMKGKLKVLAALMVLGLALLFTPLSGLAATDSSSSSSDSSSLASEDSLQKIKQKGTLVVGTSADYPPYEFVTKKNGKTEYVGFEMDVAKQFAKDLGVKLVIKNMDFDSLLVALESHKVDVVIAGMNITPERQKSVDFSKPYYVGKKYFLINKSDQNKFKSTKDFTGKKVGAQNGAMEYDLVKKNIPNVEEHGLAKLTSLVIALQSHKVDGVLMDAATAKAYVNNNDNLVTFNSKIKTNSSGIAMAFPKGATSLEAAANQTVKKINQEDLINKKWIPQASQYMQSYQKTNTVASYWKFFAKGAGDTVVISIVATIGGIILGMLVALMRLAHNKVLKGIAIAYIEFLRGTPMLVQIMFVYFGIGAIIQSMPAIVAGIIAIAVNSGAYVAEDIRSGIQSISLGQTEAARSLGMSQSQTYRYVVIPQALRNIWPALGNEFVTLLKDSSLVSTIGVGELMYQTQVVQSDTYKGVLPLFITMMIYFVMTFLVTRLLNLVEKKLKRG